LALVAVLATGFLVTAVVLFGPTLVAVALTGMLVFVTVVGLREASRERVGAANTGIVATPKTPTPTHVRNFLLNIETPEFKMSDGPSRPLADPQQTHHRTGS